MCVFLFGVSVSTNKLVLVRNRDVCDGMFTVLQDE
jgi:hypothetical protein